MKCFERLAIGTANWGQEYNGAKVSEDDQKRILDYCQCSGIDMIDTATAYGWDWTKVNSYFNVVVKIQTKEDIKATVQAVPYCVMLHNIKEQMPFQSTNEIKSMGHRLVGYSVYDLEDISKLPLFSDVDNIVTAIIQIPYSIYDRRFEICFEDLKGLNYEIHVRSVFLRGKLLKEFSPFECISFCLMNPYVDRVIIGADSYEQFKSNLRPFHNMNVAEKHDINLLDPRKWK